MSAPLYTSRRRRRRPALAYAACIVVGLAVGIGGSMVRPGPWFGPADAFDRPERHPAVGDVLCLQGECVYVVDALEVGDDDRIVVVQWLRGKHGRDAYRVTDCDAGTGVVYPLADERQRQRWERDGTTIVDRIAEAACGPSVTS